MDKKILVLVSIVLIAGIAIGATIQNIIVTGNLTVNGTSYLNDIYGKYHVIVRSDKAAGTLTCQSSDQRTLLDTGNGLSYCGSDGKWHTISSW